MANITNPLLDAINNLADEIKRLRRELHVLNVFGREQSSFAIRSISNEDLEDQAALDLADIIRRHMD